MVFCIRLPDCLAKLVDVVVEVVTAMALCIGDQLLRRGDETSDAHD